MSQDETTAAEKSAAERAREDANKALSLDADCSVGEVTEHEWFSASRPLFANMARHIIALTQGLSTATERAEDQEAQRLKTLEWAGELKERAEKAEKEWDEAKARHFACQNTLLERDDQLTTSRAAHDKLKEWALLARPVVEAVRAVQEEGNSILQERMAADLIELPLPPKETT